MSFQAPTSLASTLAGFASRKSSVDSAAASQKSTAIHDEDATASDSIYERTLPSLHFLRWRPRYHLLAPNGWMNDPCAPGYDPSTGLYHVSFQWNPRRNVYGKISWGNISWGHATSPDLIHWTTSGTASLTPGAWYDRQGCFTGCMHPTGVDGSPGKLTIFYTGVNQLPLHYTLAYNRGCELQNIAQSTDGGATWTKYKANPFLSEPPPGVTVSGWRDPFVAPWPSLDRVMGRPEGENTLYGVISGGLKDGSPTAFLYAVNRNNLAQWIYICALVELGLNHIISRWSGDLGINWECANFMTLQDDDETTRRDFIIVGGEGSKSSESDSTFAEYPQKITTFPRTARSQQWMCGSLFSTQNPAGHLSPKMGYISGGRFDHGLLYGVNTFFDPVTKKQIAWGWITEEDLPQKLVDRQNWSGLLSLPRELKLVALHSVKGALVSALDSITSIEIIPEPAGTYTVHTLGMSPAKHLEALRHHARELVIPNPNPLLSSDDCFLDVQTCRFELYAALFLSSTCTRIGFSIFHTQDHDYALATTIYFSPATETLTVERPDSTHLDPNINTADETAPFTLFTFATAEGDEREALQLRVWFDESVLEIFANERCALSTRVYPGTKRCWGVQFWSDDSGPDSRLLKAGAWDGLRADFRVS